MAAQVVQQQAAVFAPSAEVVGNAFAIQYYMILEKSPEYVYRFYQEVSKLGRADDGGAMSSITTMKDIDEKILSYGSLKADIKFVDTQESSNGGVIVVVTGSMIKADNSRQGFIQTFFLAPQHKGYFVLNDIFRYLDDDYCHSVKQDDDMPPTSPGQEETFQVQEHQNAGSNGEVYNQSDNNEVPIEAGDEKEGEEPVAEVVDEAPDESPLVTEPNVKDDEEPKKSYASIVMQDAPAVASSIIFPKSAPKTQEKQVPPPAPVAVVPTSNADIDDGNNQEQKGGHSIYVRNLPMNSSYRMIEEEFKRFGPIKSDGIQICYNKGLYFGFVEFELASSVQIAIQASPISIAGHRVVIEEKKSPNYRGSYRGRYPVRGGFRGEGVRGRGSFGVGRGYNCGESNMNDYGNRGNSCGYQNRGREGYYRSDQMGNGVARVNRGGRGSGFGAARVQRVSAQG